MKIKLIPNPSDHAVGLCLEILDRNDEPIGQIHSPGCFENNSGKWEVTAWARHTSRNVSHKHGKSQRTDWKTWTKWVIVAVCDTYEEAKAAAIAYWF